MKVIITAVNSKFSHSNPAVYSLRNYVEPHHECIIHECTINSNLHENILTLAQYNADIYIFSVYIWNRNFVFNIARDLALLKPNVLMFFGGPEVSYNAENIINDLPENSCIITSGGEKAIETLSKNNFRVKDKIFKESNYKFNDIKFFYKDTDFSNFNNRYLYYESSRGCPFKCSYCLSSRSDQKIELKNIDKVLRELNIINENYSGTVKFVDRTFNASKEHSRKIWKYLSSIETTSVFHFEIFPDKLDDIDFEILAEVPGDRFQFEIGIQTVIPETLKTINRVSNLNKAQENIQKLLKLGNIHIHLDLIAGLPGETIKDIEKTFNFISSLKPHHFQPGFLKVLPGTDIADNAEYFGLTYSTIPPYQVYKTNTLSLEEINLLEKIESIVDSIYNNSFFSLSRNILLRNDILQFEHYKLFAEYLSNNEINISGRKISFIIDTLIYFFYENSSTNVNALIDCLRYEWASNSSATNYLDKLESAHTETVKRKSIEIINNDNKEWHYPFHKKETGRLIFYQAETTFMQEQLGDKIYYFLKKKTISQGILS